MLLLLLLSLLLLLLLILLHILHILVRRYAVVVNLLKNPTNMGGFASTDSIIEAAAEWNMSIMLRGDSKKLLEPTHDCTGCLGSLRKVRMLPLIANWQLALKVARLAQVFSGQHP